MKEGLKYHSSSHSPTAVGQYISFPSLQLMRSANLLKDLLTWFQAKVIGVVQTQVASRLGQLFWCETFQGGLSSNWLKDRQRDRAMG